MLARREPSWGWFDARLAPDRMDRAPESGRGALGDPGADRWRALRAARALRRAAAADRRDDARGCSPSAGQLAPGVRDLAAAGQAGSFFLESDVRQPSPCSAATASRSCGSGPRGVEANLHSATFAEVARLRGGTGLLLEPHADAPPRWQRVSTAPRYAWVDLRTVVRDGEVPEAVRRRGKPAELLRWAVPVRIGAAGDAPRRARRGRDGVEAVPGRAGEAAIALRRSTMGSSNRRSDRRARRAAAARRARGARRESELRQSDRRSRAPTRPTTRASTAPSPTTRAATTRPATRVFEENFELFGFAPETTENTAKYLDPNDPNFAAGQISGVRADTAWQQGRGRGDVAIAILDTGVRWNNGELRRKIRLNCKELPAPRPGGVATPGSSPGCREPGFVYDLSGDLGFDVDDYAGDPAVNPASSPRGTGAIDGIDLINAFSNGADEDANGYVDDIAGWDYFDGDNDPDDASSYASAGNHGSGRAEEAAGHTNNDAATPRCVPYCQFVPLRVWDTFIPDGGNFAQAIAYAADNGIEVTEAAVGVLTNSRFAREAHQYAYERGVALMSVSSDLNTANHNFPTNYNHTIFVSGIVADVEGLGQGGNEFFPPVPIGTQVPVETLVPQFRSLPVRRPPPHQHDGRHGQPGDRPGVGRRGPAREPRARERHRRSRATR